MYDAFKKEVSIPVGTIAVPGDLLIPSGASGVVIFSHGSGSSRLSPRNRMVANYLHKKRLGTLLFDLLTREEDMNYSNRFDIDLLTERLVRVTEWLEVQPFAKDHSLGYFGASTGAASALRAAAALPQIAAVVSRGGRPDLAKEALNRVAAPVLLIVGGLDEEVIQLNQQALAALQYVKKMSIIPGASHLFEEPGTMEQVCEEAADWFIRYLR